MFEDEEIDKMNQEIIHDGCGLNVELCVCPDATIKLDEENNVFIVKRQE